MKKILFGLLALTLPVLIHAQDDQGGSSADDLAKKLQNPIASIISVPFQNNFDFGIGPFDGSRWTMNMQPVIPISIGPEWNLITRTVIPLISQNDVFAPGSSQTGLSDMVASAWFSPKEPTPSGLIWGAGPVLLVPIATDELLGTEKFGVGPTVVILQQAGAFTYGGLVNHIWSVAGSDTRADVNQSFIQPFVARNFPGGYALTAVAEITQNWEFDASSGVFAIVGSKVVTIGKQATQVAVGPRVFFGNAKAANWGLRAAFTLLFPK
ncbi:hypothetical protein [Robiginitalea sediminis]|uniref:hypothetical protein n=1 Tax=Robiginitalea sediminis TaxID=1982593 RepID=UPI000B4B37BD|nr:hypothetical protein [Robiginitalea sediminis]